MAIVFHFPPTNSHCIDFDNYQPLYHLVTTTSIVFSSRFEVLLEFEANNPLRMEKIPLATKKLNYSLSSTSKESKGFASRSKVGGSILCPKATSTN